MPRGATLARPDDGEGVGGVDVGPGRRNVGRSVRSCLSSWSSAWSRPAERLEDEDGLDALSSLVELDAHRAVVRGVSHSGGHELAVGLGIYTILNIIIIIKIYIIINILRIV